MLRGLGSVESVGSKRRQAAWTRQVATAGAVLTSVDRSAVPRARALPQSSRCRLAPAPAPPGPTPPSSSARSAGRLLWSSPAAMCAPWRCAPSPPPWRHLMSVYRLNVSGRGDSSLYNFGFVSTHTHAPTHTQRATLPQRTGAHTRTARPAAGPRRARERETERARAVSR